MGPSVDYFNFYIFWKLNHWRFTWRYYLSWGQPLRTFTPQACCDSPTLLKCSIIYKSVSVQCIPVSAASCVFVAPSPSHSRAVAAVVAVRWLRSDAAPSSWGRCLTLRPAPVVLCKIFDVTLQFFVAGNSNWNHRPPRRGRRSRWCRCQRRLRRHRRWRWSPRRARFARRPGGEGASSTRRFL